jgi:hypothetical protein
MAPSEVAANHFSLDTQEFLRLLDQRNVRYLIVGGEAVIFYGHVRLTGDVDFFYAIDDENVAGLFEALVEFWEGDIPGVGGAEDLAVRGQIIQFGVPPNRIDLINDIDGVVFDEAWPDRVLAELTSPERSIPITFIGREHLVRNKRASNRPKDLDDLQFLERRPK